MHKPQSPSLTTHIGSNSMASCAMLASSFTQVPAHASRKHASSIPDMEKACPGEPGRPQHVRCPPKLCEFVGLLQKRLELFLGNKGTARRPQHVGGARHLLLYALLNLKTMSLRMADDELWSEERCCR